MSHSTTGAGIYDASMPVTMLLSKIDMSEGVYDFVGVMITYLCIIGTIAHFMEIGRNMRRNVIGLEAPVWPIGEIGAGLIFGTVIGTMVGLTWPVSIPLLLYYLRKRLTHM